MHSGSSRAFRGSRVGERRPSCRPAGTSTSRLWPLLGHGAIQLPQRDEKPSRREGFIIKCPRSIPVLDCVTASRRLAAPLLGAAGPALRLRRRRGGRRGAARHGAVVLTVASRERRSGGRCRFWSLPFGASASARQGQATAPLGCACPG